MKFGDSNLVVTVRWFLIVILAVSIVSKLSGRPEDSFLSPIVYFGLAILEVGIVFLLVVPKWKTLGLSFSLALGLSGLIIAAIIPDGQSCGCLGNFVELSKAQHKLLSCGIGGISAVGLILIQTALPGEPRTASEEQ